MYELCDGRQVSFDADWASQRLSEAQYCLAVEQAEATYWHALTLLLSALQRAPE